MTNWPELAAMVNRYFPQCDGDICATLKRPCIECARVRESKRGFNVFSVMPVWPAIEREHE